MALDRDTPPSPGLVQMARRAGLRPHSSSLGRGIFVLFAAWVIPWWIQTGPDLPVSDALHGADMQPWSGVSSMLGFALRVWVVLVAAGLMGVFLGGVWGGVGPVDPRARRTLGRRASFGSPWLGRGLIVGLVGILAVVILRDVVAGASRAVDASSAGLFTLWQVWLVRTLRVVGLLWIAAGLVELALDARRIRRSLRGGSRTIRRTRAGHEGATNR